MLYTQELVLCSLGWLRGSGHCISNRVMQPHFGDDIILVKACDLAVLLNKGCQWNAATELYHCIILVLIATSDRTTTNQNVLQTHSMTAT